MPERSPRLALVLLLSAAASSCVATRGPGAAVTPQRPTLSSDTATTAEGTLELESGVTSNPGDSIDVPMNLKYGLSDTTEVFVGGSPIRWVDRGTSDELGVGDLMIGTRHRVLDQDRWQPSVAVLGALKLPTGDEEDGLGSGEVESSFAGIATMVFGPTVVTGYYALDLLGDPTGHGTVVGHELALATATTWAAGVAGFAELATVLVPELDNEPVYTTLGVALAPRRSFAYDVGVVVGLNDDVPDYQFVVGLTRNFGRPVQRAGR